MARLTIVAQVTIQDVKRAGQRTTGVVRRTPLERSRWLSDGLEAHLKLECFQVTGSFKIRGAISKLAALSEDQKRRGVIAISAGNHGLAVAHCAELLGLQATILVPKSASQTKVEAIRRYPVTLIQRGANYDEAERAARVMQRETGLTFVSPYNDLEIIAGQGTVAVEILEDRPNLEVIVVPVGGGGLLAGIAVAAKAIDSKLKVYGVESVASPTMHRALQAGHLVQIEEEETIADGLAGNIEPGSITFPIIQQFVDGIILVSEEAIRSSIARMAREDHLIIEGAAAASVAALVDSRLRGRRVAAIVTGRNISVDVFKSILAAA